MRFFSSILIIIIIAIHFVPCSDAYALLKKNSKSEIVKKRSYPQQDKFDDCSPFCSCACCTIQSVTKAQLTVILHPPYFSPNYPEYPKENFIDVSLPVWQPPQLV